MDLHDFISTLNENALTEDECYRLNGITYGYSGIKDVVIWIGPSKEEFQVKIGNITNDFGGRNCFTLTLPDYRTKGKINRKLITDEVLNDIKKFIEINFEVIKDCSYDKISTYQFVKKLKSIM